MPLAIITKEVLPPTDNWLNWGMARIVDGPDEGKEVAITHIWDEVVPVGKRAWIEEDIAGDWMVRTVECD